MSLLRNETVLIVDCQTTGSSPASGDLLELGWARYCASDPIDKLESHSTHRLIEPGQNSIPRRVTELTGITDDDLAEAHDRKQVWNEFQSALDSVNFLVAHYAQFEVRFLQALADEHKAGISISNRTICTHEMARRLLNGLPRKGIRPIAGYWGHSLPEQKRTRHHVPATALIWSQLTDRLAENHGVESVHDVQKWIERTDPDRNDGYEYLIDRDRRLSLPDEPGVYRLLNRKNRVLYVGKATSLRSRVNSYFQSGSGLSESKLEMVSQVNDVEVEPVATPLEASLLEVDQIKQHDPPYNSNLLDDGRSVQYASPDLSSWLSEPSHPEMVGPTVQRRPIEQLGMLRQWIRNPEETLEPSRRYLKELHDAETFHNGLQQLIDTWNLDEPSDNLAQLREIGRELWDRDHDDDPDEDVEDNTLTTGEVLHRLENIIKWGTRTIRRGDWFRRVRWCDVYWKTQRDAGHPWRSLELRDGQVESVSSLDEINEPNLESFRHNPKDPLTLSGFDRLRVLTTELKRLTKNNRPLRLRPGDEPSTLLNGRELDTILETI